MRSNIILLSVLAIAICACTHTEIDASADHSQDNGIGTPLTTVSSLTTDQGTDESKVSLYDSTVDLIHQFDLNKTTKDRTISPRYPGGTHYVLFDPSGNYVIDLTAKHLTVHNGYGTVQEPVHFVDTPKFASFRPSLGYLVVYDDQHSVALLKFDSQGNVTGSAMMGPIVSPNISISSGDIDDQGRLVLSLSNDTIVLIDIGQSINSGAWTFWNGVQPFSVGLSHMAWIAPVHDQPNQILVKTNSPEQVALVDVNAKAVLGSPMQVGSGKVIKTSKSYDPHFLIKYDSGLVNIVYAQGGALRTTATTNMVRNVLSSRLNLANQSWSLIDSNHTMIQIGTWWYDTILYDDPNVVGDGRLFKKYNISSMLPTTLIGMPDTAQLQVTEAHIFALFPNKLGRAANYSTVDGKSTELDWFNYPYLHDR